MDWCNAQWMLLSQGTNWQDYMEGRNSINKWEAKFPETKCAAVIPIISAWWSNGLEVIIFFQASNLLNSKGNQAFLLDTIISEVEKLGSCLRTPVKHIRYSILSNKCNLLEMLKFEYIYLLCDITYDQSIEI